MILYVNSVHTSALERSPGVLFHTCDLKGVQSFVAYTDGDQKAMEVLDEAGVHYDLVDLSRLPFAAKINVRLHGIHRTPTLVLDNGTKLDSIKQIEHAYKARSELT